MTTEYECPVCYEPIKVTSEQKTVTCRCCGTAFNINHDAEFIDGRWIDLTTLTRIKL